MWYRGILPFRSTVSFVRDEGRTDSVESGLSFELPPTILDKYLLRYKVGVALQRLLRTYVVVTVSLFYFSSDYSSSLLSPRRLYPRVSVSTIVDVVKNDTRLNVPE